MKPLWALPWSVEGRCKVLWGAPVVPSWEGASTWVQVFTHILCSTGTFGNKSCLPLFFWHPPTPIRHWRYDVFSTSWHSQIWIGSALIFDEMHMVAFLLLPQDSWAGSPDQPVLCLNGRSWDSKWESFQVWMYLFMKMGFYYPKEIIWICVVYCILFIKYIVMRISQIDIKETPSPKLWGNWQAKEQLGSHWESKWVLWSGYLQSNGWHLGRSHHPLPLPDILVFHFLHDVLWSKKGFNFDEVWYLFFLWSLVLLLSRTYWPTQGHKSLLSFLLTIL